MFGLDATEVDCIWTQEWNVLMIRVLDFLSPLNGLAVMSYGCGPALFYSDAAGVTLSLTWSMLI